MKFLPKHFILLFLLGIVVSLIQAMQRPLNDAVIERKLINDYNIYAIPIPEKMDFAGSCFYLLNLCMLKILVYEFKRFVVANSSFKLRNKQM